LDYASGDVFFGLDFQPALQISNRDFFQELRRQGVCVKFMVYDLLCITMQEHFVPGTSEHFSQWLNVITQSDGAVCISKAVADELADWTQHNDAAPQRPFSIDWVHLGAGITHEYAGLVRSKHDLIKKPWVPQVSFLMVGTVESRKGHAHVLDAFENLWKRGFDLSLVVVGKKGWMVDALVKRLRKHSELNKRLFWHEGISDEHLEQIYVNSTCLIAASYGEGFGLPLIEAAQHKLPIIARDIAVFKEVAGDHAYYFKSKEPAGLAQEIDSWLALYKTDQHPKSDNMPWLTWGESSTKLLDALGLKKSDSNTA
jgi:glycosyltransferase involved in cell wall biosynthesis